MQKVEQINYSDQIKSSFYKTHEKSFEGATINLLKLKNLKKGEIFKDSKGNQWKVMDSDYNNFITRINANSILTFEFNKNQARETINTNLTQAGYGQYDWRSAVHANRGQGLNFFIMILTRDEYQREDKDFMTGRFVKDGVKIRIELVRLAGDKTTEKTPVIEKKSPDSILPKEKVHKAKNFYKYTVDRSMNVKLLSTLAIPVLIEGKDKVDLNLEAEISKMTTAIEKSLTKAYGKQFAHIKAKVDKLKDEFKDTLENTKELQEEIQKTYNLFIPTLSQLGGIDDGEDFKRKNWSELENEPPTTDGWLVADFDIIKKYLETKLEKVSDKQVYEEQFTTSARSANGQIQTIIKDYLEALQKLNDLFGKIKDVTKEVVMLP